MPFESACYSLCVYYLLRFHRELGGTRNHVHFVDEETEAQIA